MCVCVCLGIALPPKRVVGCSGGGRYVEGWWGIPLIENENVSWSIGFLFFVYGFLVVGFLISWFLGRWLLGFLVSHCFLGLQRTFMCSKTFACTPP